MGGGGGCSDNGKYDFLRRKSECADTAQSAVERHFKREYVTQIQNCIEAPNEFALSGAFVFYA